MRLAVTRRFRPPRRMFHIHFISASKPIPAEEGAAHGRNPSVSAGVTGGTGLCGQFSRLLR